jgi:glycogen synthase
MKPTIVKKVLMTADTVGGVWTYAVELIRAFQDYGIQVLLATMGRPISDAQRDDLRDVENVETAESSYRLEWMEDPWADVNAAGKWLLRLEREFAPDIVHLNGYSHAALPWIAPRIVVAHSCVLSWWRAVKGAPAPESWQIYHDHVQAGLRAANMVVAPSAAMLKCLAENYGEFPAGRVIANGRRLDLFQPREKENFILSAGRLWDEAKNVRAVCACSLNLPWPVCVAGETEFPGTSGVDPHQNKSVRTLGRLSERAMLDQMARASIFAHPAKYEPFGLSVLEAALSGCALVLGDIPALCENWSHAAVFVDPNDCEQLQQALLRLINNSGERDALAYAAREHAQHLDIRSTASRYIDAYESLLGARDSQTSPSREECVAA